MSHSPLETVILFHIGIVPISGTVVTTWGLIAALTVASWMVTRSFSVDAGGRQAMIETDRDRNRRPDRSAAEP